MRIRRDVKILGLPAEQEIAHAAARQVSQEPDLVKAIEHLQRLGRNLPAADGMLRSINDNWRHGRAYYTAGPGKSNNTRRGGRLC